MIGERVRRVRLASIAAIAGLTTLCVAGFGAPGTRQPESATQLAAHQPARPIALGPLIDSEPVDFDLALVVPRERELDAFLVNVEDPASPEYHRYLPAAQVGARFGLSDAQIGRVEAWLTGQGVSVVETYPQRTLLRVRGPARGVERLLSVRLRAFRDPRTGLRYQRPTVSPRIPRPLRNVVAGVTGLDDKPLRLPGPPRGPTEAARAPEVRGVGRDSASATGKQLQIPPNALTPQVLQQAFDLGPLYSAGIRGAGQFVAVASFGSVSDASVAASDALVGTTDAPPIKHIQVGAGAVASGDDTEAALDVDTIRAVAPQSQILNFELTKFTGAFAVELFNAIVKDGRARIASASWGVCDRDLSFKEYGMDRRASEQAIEAARSTGMNIFVSSGDQGAYSCRRLHPDDLEPTPLFPGDSQDVTSVGGTYLDRGGDGTYVGEAGWEDPLSGSGTGGGLSPHDSRPAWQRAPGVQNASSNGKRQFPDVSGPADPATGYLVVERGQRGFEPEVIGGTSGSTPFWAGLTALYQQLAGRVGVPRLGFLNPTLYALAASQPPNTLFHDVVRGGNLLEVATPGWDYATGLGSPIAAPLGNAIVGYLRGHPVPTP